MDVHRRSLSHSNVALLHHHHHRLQRLGHAAHRLNQSHVVLHHHHRLQRLSLAAHYHSLLHVQVAHKQCQDQLKTDAAAVVIKQLNLLFQFHVDNKRKQKPDHSPQVNFSSKNKTFSLCSLRMKLAFSDPKGRLINKKPNIIC